MKVALSRLLVGVTVFLVAVTSLSERAGQTFIFWMTMLPILRAPYFICGLFNPSRTFAGGIRYALYILYVDVGDWRTSAVLYWREWSPLSRNERTCSRRSRYVFFTYDYPSISWPQIQTDNVPLLRRRHPVSASPNPWSHPLPIFTYEESQIRVHFLSDPAMPICSEDIYPNEAWISDDLVLTAHSEKPLHRHKITDFASWIPRNMMETIFWAYDKRSAPDDKDRKVLVEEKPTMNGTKILWDIIPISNSSASVEEHPS